MRKILLGLALLVSSTAFAAPLKLTRPRMRLSAAQPFRVADSIHTLPAEPLLRLLSSSSGTTFTCADDIPLLSTDCTFTVAVTGNFSFSGNTETLSQALALGTTAQTSPSLSLNSTTAALVNAQQISGSIEQCGNGWKTTATAGSEVVCNGWYTLPVQGTTNPTDAYVWYTNVNAGTRTARLKLVYDGTNSWLQAAGSAYGIKITASGVTVVDGSGVSTAFVSGNIVQSGNNRLGTVGATSNAFYGVYSGHIESSESTLPTCAVGAGAGAGATCSLGTNSTDMAGSVTVVVGTLPTISSTLVTVTFRGTYDTAAICVAVPSNAAAALQSSQIFPSATFSATTFALATGTTGASAATLVFNYHCMGGTNAY